MNNPFEAIADIQKRRLAFLEDTASHYRSKNRSQPELAFKAPCTYYPVHSGTEGCAIGRWLERDSPIIISRMNGTVKNPKIFDLLPIWMQEMGGDFLDAVQSLHDKSSNWDETGLTTSGLCAKKRILSDLRKNEYE